MPFRWATLWLILHISSWFVAFGPNFIFPLIANRAQREPQHALFANETLHWYSTRISVPLAVLVPTFGTLLIVTKRYDFWRSEWLIAAASLYLVDFLFANLFERRWAARVSDVLRGMSSGGSAGPPDELVSLGKKLAAGGAFLTLSLFVLITLMVWKPGAAFLPPK